MDMEKEAFRASAHKQDQGDDGGRTGVESLI